MNRTSSGFLKKIKYEYSLYLTKGYVDWTEAKKVAFYDPKFLSQHFTLCKEHEGLPCVPFILYYLLESSPSKTMP